MTGAGAGAATLGSGAGSGLAGFAIGASACTSGSGSGSPQKVSALGQIAHPLSTADAATAISKYLVVLRMPVAGGREVVWSMGHFRCEV